MTARVLGRAVAALMICVALTACAPVPQEAPVSLTLDQAKAETRAAEDEILALIPEAIVTARPPRPETTRTLFACDEPGTYTWPGGVQLGIAPATDSGAVITAVHDAWAGRDGWETTWKERGEDGVFHLDLYRADGLHLAVMNLEGNTLLDISSFSPCVAMGDVDPNARY